MNPRIGMQMPGQMQQQMQQQVQGNGAVAPESMAQRRYASSPQPPGGQRGARGRVSPQMMAMMQARRQRMMGGSGLGAPMQGGLERAVSPEDTMMSGGQAMGLRGMLQKRQMNQPGGPGQNRVGTGDQQGGLARALQTSTGRPPISRRMAFPGTR